MSVSPTMPPPRRAAAAVGVDAHCEGGGILPSFLPPSLARAIAGEDHGPPSLAAAGRGFVRGRSFGRQLRSKSHGEPRMSATAAAAKTSCRALCATTRHRVFPFPSMWYPRPLSISVPGRDSGEIPNSGRVHVLSQLTADYDINSFARAVLKHKGAFSGGIRRATVIIPRGPRNLL